MIRLNNIQRFTLNEDYPQSWDDLDWNNPTITDPRYLYSIYRAIHERIAQDRVIPTYKADPMCFYTIFDAHGFKNDVAFTYRYFEILYSLVITTLPIFYNDAAIERAWKFEDGKGVGTPELMQYNDAEMSNIIGYDYREIPQPFQPFRYYQKYLIGMKKAIQAMKWIYYPLLLAGNGYSNGYSYGYAERDENDNWGNFRDGSWTEAYGKMGKFCADTWERRKSVAPDAVGTVITTQRRNWLYNTDSDGDKYLAGTYDNFAINGRLVNEMWLESHFAWPYATTVKVFYVPTYTGRADTTIFQDNSIYRTYLKGADFGNKIKLWSEEQTEPHKRFRSSRKFSITWENIEPPTNNFAFKENEVEVYNNNIYPHWFGILDISGGCKFK